VDSRDHAHPAKGTIAKAIGCTPRAVQRRIAEMEDKGLIKRIERRETGAGSDGSKPNLYDFSGLIKAAKPYAAAKADKIAMKKAKTAPKGNVVKFPPKKDV
jgi:predicted transcriptional regulator